MNNTYFVPPGFKGPQGQEDMPFLLTPGPVTTSRASKIAMLSDYGTEHPEFRSIVNEVRRELKRLTGGDESYECVLLPGPSEFAIEAVLGSTAPAKRKKTLVVGNGMEGNRTVAMLEAMGRHAVPLSKPDAALATTADIAGALDGDADISHVWMAQCDVATGAVAAIEDIGKLVKERGKAFIVDASSSFGALPLDMVKDQIDTLIGTSGACLEGAPGLSFIIIKREQLINSEGKGHSLVLDLFAEWQEQESHGRFRFGCPTHVLVALRQALRELEAEGGIGMRRARYQRNAEELITRMRAMGFTPLLPDTEAGPIVQCFLAPRDPKFVFVTFAEHLRQRGFEISAGALSNTSSIRVGCIGQINDKVIKAFARAVEAVLKEMDVQEFSPVAS